jgi:hypothetical protein
MKLLCFDPNYVPPAGLLQKRRLHLLAAVLGSLLIVSFAFAGELQALCSAAKDFASAAKTQEAIVITYPTADELAVFTMGYAGKKKRYLSEFRSAMPILIAIGLNRDPKLPTNAKLCWRISSLPGTLVVASPQALGLGDLVVNGGILRANPQPINVKGNYTQNSGGTLQLGIGGSAAGQYGFLNVTGHATLGGTLDLVSLGGFQPKVGDKLTLAIAGGGISGQFANVVDPFAVFLLDFLYGQNTFVLEFLGTDFAAFAQTSSLKLDVGRRWSDGLWKLDQIESKTVGAFA